MKASERKYTGVLQYFHNYEHDPEGRTHCLGMLSNPYVIEHKSGGHLISTEYAKGHGKLNEPKWFRFTKKFGRGFDMASAVEVKPSEIPPGGKENIAKWADILYKLKMREKDHVE